MSNNNLEEEKYQEWKDAPIEKTNFLTKKLFKTFKKYRPDKNKIDFGNKGKLSWQVKPKFSSIKDTKLKLQYDGNIEDVEFYVKVEGKPYKICKEGLQADDSFNTEFGFTKKF